MKKAFTLIEILVTSAVVATLAAIIFVSVEKSKMSSRDSKRIADVGTIASTMIIYKASTGEATAPKVKMKNSISPGAVTGYNHEGHGWFNFEDGQVNSYQHSIVNGLIDNGFLEKEVIDPTGARSGATKENKIYAYMYYLPGPNGTVYAKLENASAQKVSECLADTLGSPAAFNSCNELNSDFGMNFMLRR